MKELLKAVWGRIKSEIVNAACALVTVITIIVYAAYGATYNYFDLIVFYGLMLSLVCNVICVAVEAKWSNLFKPLSVMFMCVAFSLFFLNSVPVWADRLNNITMYGSRGTLVPVVFILVFELMVIVAGIVSCFLKDKGDKKNG